MKVLMRLVLLLGVVTTMAFTEQKSQATPHAPSDKQVEPKKEEVRLPDVSKDTKINLRDIQAQFLTQETIIKNANAEIDRQRQIIVQAQTKENQEIGPRWQAEKERDLKAVGLPSDQYDISVGETAAEIVYTKKEAGKK